MVADASAISFGVVVEAPKQKQIPATKPIAIDTMLNAVGRSLMSSNVQAQGRGAGLPAERPSGAVG